MLETVLWMTALAGVGGTGAGGILTCGLRRDGERTISLLLSFAAGVMLAVVCGDLLTDALSQRSGVFGLGLTVGGVLMGYGLIGLLNRITALYLRRKINIESLKVSESSIRGISMFVISAFTTRETIDKLVKQLRNIIDVIQVEYYSNEELITQEIALYKITSKIFRESGTVDRIVREWNARIIEMNPQYVVVEKTGTREDIDAMRSELEQQQLLTEFTRSGTVVLHRDSVEDKLQANL